MVEGLRTLLADHDVDKAASLVFVSGKPRQVLLNSLSSSAIELPPLDADSLRMAMTDACRLHCGETRCVTSNTNGGGKTHYIMKTIGKRQSEGEELLYRRIPLRESSTAESVVDSLSFFASHHHSFHSCNAFHVDIAHILPVDANTILFELLIVGVLKHRTLCKVYHRSSSDLFFLEIPNSVKEVTSRALRFCSILPQEHLVVSRETTDTIRPIFTDPECTRISSPEYTEMVFVCKFLRAYQQGKFRPGDRFDPSWDPWLMEPPSSAECFDIVSQYVGQDGRPTFLLFHSFLQFMYTAFVGMNSYGPPL